MPLNPQIPLAAIGRPIEDQNQAVARALAVEDARLKRDITLRDMATEDTLRMLYAPGRPLPTDREVLQAAGPAGWKVIQSQAQAEDARRKIAETTANTDLIKARTVESQTTERKTATEAQIKTLERDQAERKDILGQLWSMVSLSPESPYVQPMWDRFRQVHLQKFPAEAEFFPERYDPQLARALTQKLVSDHDNYQAFLDSQGPQAKDQPKYAAEWNVELARAAQGLRPGDETTAAQIRDYLSSAGAPGWVTNQIPLRPTEADIAQLRARGMTVEEQSQAAARAAQTQNAAAQTAVAQGNLAMRQKEFDQSEGLKSKLTPEAIDMFAVAFAQGQGLPSLGAGKAAVEAKEQIANRAIQLFPSVQPALARALYQANTDSLRRLTVQANSMQAFEKTALANLQVFLDRTKNIADTGSPLLNRPVRSFANNVLGSADMSAAMTARRTVVPEFARLLSGGNLNTVLSDSARHEVDQLLDENATLGQWRESAKVLVQDAHNRRRSTDEEIAAIRGSITRMSGATPGAQPVAPPANISTALANPTVPTGTRVKDPATGVYWVKRADGTVTKE